jgi:hypothetical protein
MSTPPAPFPAVPSSARTTAEHGASAAIWSCGNQLPVNPVHPLDVMAGSRRRRHNDAHEGASITIDMAIHCGNVPRCAVRCQSAWRSDAMRVEALRAAPMASLSVAPTSTRPSGLNGNKRPSMDLLQDGLQIVHIAIRLAGQALETPVISWTISKYGHEAMYDVEYASLQCTRPHLKTQSRFVWGTLSPVFVLSWRRLPGAGVWHNGTADKAWSRRLTASARAPLPGAAHAWRSAPRKERQDLRGCLKQSLYMRRGYVIYRARLKTALLDNRSLDMLLKISKRLIY